MMRGLSKIVWTELKLVFRDTGQMFFTVGFPLMLLILLGSMEGNAPREVLGGLGNVDYRIPGYIGWVLTTT